MAYEKQTWSCNNIVTADKLNHSVIMLTLICGIPNAGKTTYSERYDNVIHLDDISPKGGQIANCNFTASLAQGDVCVEGVYGRAHQRRALVRACKSKSPKICIWLDTSFDECVRREREYRKRPTGLVRLHNSTFEPPTLAEGWDEIIHIKR